MRSLVCVVALSLAACASAPPKTAQTEVPIRSQEEIARDQAAAPMAVDSVASSASVPDAATCRKHPNLPGCPGVPKKGPLDNTTTRSPRLVNAR